MNNSENNLSNSFFSHIYIEEKAYKYDITQKIIEKYTEQAYFIPITHYKDVFNRSNQNFSLQKESPNLILAVKDGNLIYPGAKVCQDFGHNHFYYTSCMMNCIYDCEYCYLQGMYPSANIVLFVNLEDYFAQITQLLEQSPIYLCISYDTDLLALEPLLGILHQFHAFLVEHPQLTIEVRTKSANFSAINDLSANDRFILAWTLSPQNIARTFEHRTPSTSARIQSMISAMTAGFPVRLCLDPLLYTSDWKSNYSELIYTLSSTLPMNKLLDVSLGVFRVSIDYLKEMRKQRPDSLLTQYPYLNDHGVAHIEDCKIKEMIQFIKEELTKYLDSSKLFIWEETANEHQL